MTSTITIRRIIQISLSLTLFFVLGHFFVKYQELIMGRQRLFGLVHMLDLNGEQSLPAWYQSMMLMSAACFTSVIAGHTRRLKASFSCQWTVLAYIFIGMSIDEITAFHELVGDNIIGPAIGSGGRFHSPWLLFGIPFVILFAVAYLRFFWALPVSDRKRFFWAATAYLSGVILIEIPENLFSARFGEKNMIFAAFTGLEECLEMIGLLLLNIALIKRVASMVDPTRITIEVHHGRS